jgi:hypothetical protein
MLKAPPSEEIISEMEASRPRREDYAPGTVQKILAAMAGFSSGMKDPLKGVHTARKLLDQPYEQALERHQAENEGRLQQARIGDSAFNRKLLSSQFDLTEERQRRNNEATQKQREADNKLKQDDDIRAIEENLRKQSNEDRDYELNKRKADAQIASDQERVRRSKTGTDEESLLEVERRTKLETKEDDELEKKAVQHLFKNVPGFETKFTVGPDGGLSLAELKPEESADVYKAIDLTKEQMKKQAGGKSRFRKLVK